MSERHTTGADEDTPAQVTSPVVVTAPCVEIPDKNVDVPDTDSPPSRMVESDTVSDDVLVPATTVKLPLTVATPRMVLSPAT